MSRHEPLRVLATALLAPLALAQSPTVVLRIGDPVPGAGTLTDVLAVELQQVGTFSVMVRTDDPVAHTVLYELGAATIRTGDGLPGTGAWIVAFPSVTWDPIGSPTYVAGLKGGSARQALVYGLTWQLLTGEPATKHAKQLPAGSTWRRFDDVRFSWSEPAFLLRGAIDDPAGGALDRSLVGVASHDWTTPTIGSIGVVALEGQLAPGLARKVEEVRSGPGQAGMSPSGQEVVWSCDLDGSSSDDGCVYLSRVGSPPQSILLAREGSPSPVAGRAWGSLEDAAVDINSWQGKASWALLARLDASDPTNDQVLVGNGTVLAREGETLPAIAPFPLSSLGLAHRAVDVQGRVLWYGRWDDPATAGEDEALFRNGSPLVRTGVTTVSGSVLVDIEANPKSFSFDPWSGRELVFVGRLADGTRGLFRFDMNRIQVYCAGKVNSATCLPDLLWQGGPPSVSGGSPFKVWATGILPLTATAFFYGTNGQAALPLHGGTLCVAPPLRRGPAGSSGPAGLGVCTISETFDVAAWIASGIDPALVAGQQVHLQLWYRDGGLTPPDDIGLTPGLSFWIAN